MALHRLPILDWSTTPAPGGEVFHEPYTVKATNGVWGYRVWVFNDSSTRDGLRGAFGVPSQYVDSAALIVIWTTTVIVNDVEWDFDYRAVGGDDTESLDQSGTQESVNGNDTAPSAINERMVLSIALTDGNFAPDDTVQFELFRDGTDGGDTIAAAVTLHKLYFEYADF